MPINCKYGSVRITILPPTKYFFLQPFRIFKNIHLTKSGIEWRYSLIIGLWAKTFSWITFELRIFFNEHNVARRKMPVGNPCQGHDQSSPELVMNYVTEKKPAMIALRKYVNCKYWTWKSLNLPRREKSVNLLRKTEANPHLSFF